MLIEGPADGGSDVEIVASTVSLDKKQSESRNVNLCRQEEKVKASDERECLPQQSCAHFQPWGWFLEQP